MQSIMKSATGRVVALLTVLAICLLSAQAATASSPSRTAQATAQASV